MIRNIRIQVRLLVSFFAIAFITMLAGLTGFMSLRSIGDDAVKSIAALNVLNDMYDYNVEADNGIYYMLRFRDSLIREYLDNVTAERIGKMQSFMADFIALHQSRFRHIFTPGEEQDMINLLQIYNETYLPILNEIFELHDNGDTERAISLYERRLDPIYCAIYYSVGNAFDKVFESTQETVSSNSAHASASAAFLVMMIFASFIMAVILTLVVTRSISTPLEDIRRTAEKMAHGSLDVDFKSGSGKDEFSNLAASLNETVHQLKQVQQLRMEAVESRHEKEKAEAATIAKSRFLAKMSHEIRTPMNAIVGMAELAMRENIPPAAYDQVQTIKQAGANLLSIINDLLDFSKIESGKLDILPDNYAFSTLINDVTSIIKTRIIDGPLQFIVDVDDNIPNELYGDEVRIRQVLLNILSNAVKYTENGHIRLVARGETVETKEGVSVNLTISVTDTGKGIRKEDIGKLFGEFVQVDQANNKGIEGTGLGLAITWNLVKAMGGDITVESEYGKGSTFTVTLQQMRGKSDTLALKRGARAFVAPDAKVLVVDDITTNLKVASGLLAPYSMRLTMCESGAAAIKAVSEEVFDLVFMDHMMPGMDGIEATKRIRELGDARFEKLPIVALTANAVSGMKEMFLKYGFNDFLSKPIDTIKLNMLLDQWIPAEKKVEAVDPGNFKGSEVVDIEIPGINAKNGVATSGGTVKNYLQTLAVFTKDGRKKIDELNKALEGDDLHLYTTYVHALKSAAANIGAYRLSESARVLESAGNEKNREFIRANNKRMLGDLEAILKGIDKYLAENAETQSGDVDINAVKDALAKLNSAIDEMNVSAISEAVKCLKQFTNAKNIGAEVDNILQNAMVGEYDEAAEQAEGLIKALDGGSGNG
ncbi:MAG: ATP-binding protein [Chitinispirillia bacterium]|nr:ATP-binding protein [Chitinispirillia bacterium]MCL2241145.1 ATP-binding protein [Chitinispirillia bacterium]